MAFEAHGLQQRCRGGQATGSGVEFFVHVQVDVQPVVLCGFEQVAQGLRVPIGGMHKAAQQRTGPAARHRGGQGHGGAAIGVQVQRDQAHALQRQAAGPGFGQFAQHRPGQGLCIGLPPVAVGAQVRHAGLIGPLQGAASALAHVGLGPAAAVHHHGFDGTQQPRLHRAHARQSEGLVQVGVGVHQAGQYQCAVQVPGTGDVLVLRLMRLHALHAAIGEAQVGQSGLRPGAGPGWRQQPAWQASALQQGGGVHRGPHANRAMARPTLMRNASSRGVVATFMW